MARSKRTALRTRLLRDRRLWWAVLPALLLGGCWYGYEVMVARPAMAWMGLPQATQVQPAYWTRVLRNEGFMVGYSELRANPLWVTYHLTPIAEEAPRLKRRERFESDWRSVAQIASADYTNSGYGRGHMAPNYAISRLYGAAAQRDTFLMTNVTPQRANLNRRVWQRLEELEVDTYAPQFQSLWVITGPLFDDKVERLTSSWQVEIPDSCYKILAVPAEANQGKPLLLAFIIPQTVEGSEPLAQFVTTVDRIEELSGFDLFSELPDDEEEQLESTIDTAPWRLETLGARKGRY